MLKLVYTLFLGLLLALFIGVGIATFYQSPQAPDVPVAIEFPSDKLTDEEKRTQIEFREQEEAYLDKMEVYNRNISIIGLCFAIVLLVISLIFAVHLGLLADGFLLGSVFTLLYSLIRGLASDSNVYRFIVVSISLGIAVALGYIKFMPAETKSKPKSKST